MLKFAALNFIVAMVPGNVLAPLNILLGFVCLNVAIVYYFWEV